MKLNTITTALLLGSSSLLAGFGSVSVSSSTHDTSNYSNTKSINFSWGVPTTTGDETELNGYYYKLDKASTTLMDSNDTVLASTATSKTSTVSEGDGSYYFHIAPYATNGDIGATSHFGPIKIDTTAPALIMPEGGSFSTTQNVTLSATDTNSYTIYYTLDGTTPTSSSDSYSSAIAISSTKTLKAIAIDSLGNESSVASAVFTINSTSNVAQFGSEVTAGSTIATNNSGNANVSTIIGTLSVEGSSVTHYKYQIDSENYSAQIEKSTPIDLSTLSDGGHTLSIVGYDGSSWQPDSSATTLSFTVDNTAPNAVSFSTQSGTTITENTIVTMSSTGSNAIYYTTNGETPTTNSTQGTTVTLTEADNGEVTLKAIATDSTTNTTSVAIATYTVNIEATAPSSGGGGNGGGSNTTPVTPTPSPSVDDTTGLETGDTSTQDNPDGSSTQSTTFISEAGVQIVVDITTKIDDSTTETKSDGTRIVSATTQNDKGETIESDIELKPDATVTNTIKVGNKSSNVDIDITGSDSTLNEDYSISTTTPPIASTNGETVIVDIVMKASGEIEPTLIIDNRRVELPAFEPGSSAIVRNDNGKVTIEIKVILTEKIRFK